MTVRSASVLLILLIDISGCTASCGPKVSHADSSCIEDEEAENDDGSSLIALRAKKQDKKLHSMGRLRMLRKSEPETLGNGCSGDFSMNASDFEHLVLPLPDPNGTKDDLAVIRWTNRTRSNKGVVHSYTFIAKRISAFDAALGVNTGGMMKHTSACLRDFYSKISAVKDHFKDKFARVRPFITHPEILPCLPLEPSYTYPSGHATFYISLAELLSDIFPMHRDRLVIVGEEGAWARVNCAVHYPTDVYSAIRLAKALAKEVIKSDAWKTFRASSVLQHEMDMGKLLQPPAGQPVLTS